MSFSSPIALLALAALPLLGLAYWLAQRRRQVFAIRFTNLALLAQVAPRRPGWRRHAVAGVFAVALAGLLLSLAGPALAISVPRDRASVMLAVDVSGSMAATDISPTRMEAAKKAAHSLVNALPAQAQVGLISFSASASLDAPLSTDRGSLSDAIDSLRPRGATAIGDAISLAVDQLIAQGPDSSGRRPPSLIVLLTDGGNNAGSSPEAAAARAAGAGIPIQTVGIGQPGGSVVVQGQDVGGVDETLLQRIAAQTGGAYHRVTDAGQLERIYSSLGGSFGFRTERLNLTVPLVAAGTLGLLVVAGLSLRWFRLLP